MMKARRMRGASQNYGMTGSLPPETVEAEEYIKDCYPSFRTEGKNSKIISAQEAGQIVHDKELLKRMKLHLNRLEGLAAAFNYGVVDPVNS
jgi:hypothetical protein